MFLLSSPWSSWPSWSSPSSLSSLSASSSPSLSLLFTIMYRDFVPIYHYSLLFCFVSLTIITFFLSLSIIIYCYISVYITINYPLFSLVDCYSIIFYYLLLSIIYYLPSTITIYYYHNWLVSSSIIYHNLLWSFINNYCPLLVLLTYWNKISANYLWLRNWYYVILSNIMTTNIHS